jgi:2-amino-4-hydroxy-6-hydroxymethyldihydropteridine diphosphokinase
LPPTEPDSVEYGLWAPRYREIARTFGFSLDQERVAADRLRSLLPAEARTEPIARCRARIEGREAVVVGLAPGAGAPPLHLLPPTDRHRVVLASDGAAARCLAASIVPDVIVTDLDGPVASELTANARGALVVVHAHADNVPALERWVSEFSGSLAGSWAGPPTPELIDLGGFTDGDRAAYLAEAVGASRVLLWGFDFERVEEPAGDDAGRKLRKLAFARESLVWLVRNSRTPILEWRRDGSTRPFQGGAAERSIQ